MPALDIFRRVVGDPAEQVLLRSLDVVLDSHLTRSLVDRLLQSALVEHAVSAALRGPLVDAVARDSEDLIDALEAAEVPRRVVDQLLRAGIADAVTERIVNGPELERIVASAVDTPVTRRVVARVIESGAVDETVARLLESEDLWILVDEIARSPAVSEAISYQSVGLAEQVAGVVRERSRTADARLERLARRVVGRAAPPASATFVDESLRRRTE